MQENLKKWNVSINELVEILKGSMIAIIPWIEKAKIEWKEDTSYDDWDEIVSVLYKSIIYSSILHDVNRSFNLAKYDLRYKNYKGISFIKVDNDDLKETLCAFVAFKNKSGMFNNIEVAVLDQNTLNVKDYITVPYETTKFSFVENINGKIKEINQLTVTL